MFRSSSQGLGETLEFHKISTLAPEPEERSMEKGVIQFQTKPDAIFWRWSVSLRLGIGVSPYFLQKKKNKIKKNNNTPPPPNYDAYYVKAYTGKKMTDLFKHTKVAQNFFWLLYSGEGRRTSAFSSTLSVRRYLSSGCSNIPIQITISSQGISDPCKTALPVTALQAKPPLFRYCWQSQPPELWEQAARSV